MAKATPRAWSIAKSRGIDLEQVVGTGANGYILPADIEKYLADHPKAPEAVQPERSATLTSQKDDSPVPRYDASRDTIEELVLGAVLPVSILMHLRFRQDNHEGEPTGEDLLGLRPTPVGGQFRSDPSILQWYIADRGYFNEPEMVQEPNIVQPGSNGTETEHAEGHEGGVLGAIKQAFGVSS